MKNNWSKSSNNYRIAEVSQQMEKLPEAIFKYQIDPFEQPYLTEITEKFELPSKVFQTERAFIDRVKKSWANTQGNMGLLLNGVKGTGKSITSKIISNEMGLPVILVSFKHRSLVSFINEIQQDVIIFIDEYDKIFDRYDNSLLSVMDGVMNTKHRIMFLLTSNEMYLDKNMLQRPSRIRYVKTYSDLDINTIIEVVDSSLQYPEFREATIKFISRLGIITIDLVKSIVQEVNIHQEEPEKFKDVFNISDGNKELYNVYKVENGKKEEVRQKTSIDPLFPFIPHHLEDDFYVNGHELGEIVQVNSEYEIVVEESFKDDNEEWDTRLVTYIVEPTDKQHRAFHAYAF